MSRQKPKAVALLDNLVFAPVRYMDPLGDEPDKGFIKNLFNKPEVRMTALASLFLAVTGNEGVATAKSPLIIGAICIGIYSPFARRESELNAKNIGVIFDAYPEKQPPVTPTPETLASLYRHKFYMKAGTLMAPPLSTSVMIAVDYMLSAPETTNYLQEAIAIATVHTTGYFASHWWRATRALNGEWDILGSLPPKEPAKEKAVSPSHAPAPAQS